MNFKDISRWKQRSIFFFVGLSISFICGAILIYWGELSELIFRHPFSWSYQPKYMLKLNILIKNIPLIAVAAILILRVIKGKDFRFLSFTLGIILPYVMLTSFLLFGPSVSNYVHAKSFDAQIWKNQKAMTGLGEWPPRLCMVDDLIASKKLNGLTKQEVIALLGKPEEKVLKMGASENRFVYYLGPERGLFGIDSEWLIITFKENGVVDSYRSERD